MALFIELSTDAFQDTFDQRATSAKSSRRAGTSQARRPQRGLEIKDDTYAILKVVTSTGEEIPLIDSGSPNGRNQQYTNFILQSVQEERMEKQQIVETFGDAYIFFFGEAPRFLLCSCILLNSNDFNWEAEFWANYDQYLRGTQCVQLGARVYLFYDDTVVEGYMLQASATKVSTDPLHIQLQWRMFLTNYQNISFVGDPNFPVRASLNLPNGISDVNQFALSQQSLLAGLAANQQALGFGGGESLSQSLRQGADMSSVTPNLAGIVQNAVEAFGGVTGMPDNYRRLLPLRSMISDNLDELTGQVVDAGDLDTSGNPKPPDPHSEVNNLGAQSINALMAAGVTAIDPTTYSLLGLGPSFAPAGIGVGLGASQGIVATFGASAGINPTFGVAAGAGAGIGGGFGFSGRATSALGYSSTTGYNASLGYFRTSLARTPTNSFGVVGTLQDQLNAATFKAILARNFSTLITGSVDFAGGVRVVGGVTSGVGVAGGVYGGLPPASLFSPTPTLGPGLAYGTGNGASINVGGTPSAFAMVSVSGTLSPSGFNPDDSSFAYASF